MPMTEREKKRAVALTLLQAAGDLVEFWSEKTEHEPWAGAITAEEAREIMSPWLMRLPGDAWDTRLDAPNLPEEI